MVRLALRSAQAGGIKGRDGDDGALQPVNQLLRDGMPIAEASVVGACQRLRPVLMTATTTTLGLSPLLFSHGIGSEVQRPLATVVVGGLVTSTILTLLVIPAFYTWFAVKAENET